MTARYCGILIASTALLSTLARLTLEANVPKEDVWPLYMNYLEAIRSEKQAYEVTRSYQVQRGWNTYLESLGPEYATSTYGYVTSTPP